MYCNGKDKNGCYNTINPKNGIQGGLMHKKLDFWDLSYLVVY